MASLTFARLREINVKRCEAVFRPLDDWTPEQYATAMVGEVGEACNLLKKRWRGHDKEIPTSEIGKELADVMTYLDLMCARLGINLEEAVIQKFNEVSDRRNTDIKLP